MGRFGNRQWLGAVFFALAAPLACGGTSIQGGDGGNGSEKGGSGGSNSNGVATIPGTSGAWTNGAQAVGGNGDAGSLPVVGVAGFGSVGGVGGIGFISPPFEGYRCPPTLPSQSDPCQVTTSGLVASCGYSTARCVHLLATCTGGPWQFQCLDDTGVGGAPVVGEAGAAAFAGDGNGGAGGAP